MRTVHRFTRRAAALLGVLLLVGIALACRATTLVPPPAPAEPRSVFLFDHGRHASLVLPRADGHWVRFAYGEWLYYAEGQTGLWRSAAAVLWPTRACLGRRLLTPAGGVDADEAALRAAVRVGAERVHRLEVERARVEDLLEELEDLHAARADAALWRAEVDLEFVPHPRRYHLFSNSNRQAARWLESLDVEVRGPALLSDWRVR